jgi:hypothetical protein
MQQHGAMPRRIEVRDSRGPCANKIRIVAEQGRQSIDIAVHDGFYR